MFVFGEYYKGNDKSKGIKRREIEKVGIKIKHGERKEECSVGEDLEERAKSKKKKIIKTFTPPSSSEKKM